MANVHDLKELKNQAKNLRSALARTGTDVSHSQSLELLAQSLGMRDWNTLHASATATSPRAWDFGEAVAGRYLGQPFTGRVVGAREQSRGHHALTIDFDRPVDVSRSALFAAPRRRITATVNAAGRSLSKTSDGVPHLVLSGH
ncbi:MAG: glyoxalase superfamily protein [Paracoccus sp. (in: a-proteobacteria)]|nr:glyoxalase superfamily protein [Paracoccus sp. (in: a-proteobacteria)]